MSRQPPRPSLPPDRDPAVKERHEPRWDDRTYRPYIATTAPNRERLARRQLMRRDIAVFLPMCMEAPRPMPRSQTAAARVMPLLPGYIFLCLGPSDDWAAIGETVAKLMYDPASKPVIAPPAFIAKLRALVEVWGGPIGIRRTGKGRHHLLDRPLAPNEWEHQFEIGAQVRILQEAFAGFIGTVLEERREDVKITVDIFGRTTETVIRKLWLSPATA